MISPYAPPAVSQFDATEVARSKRLFGRAAMICGLGIVVPPFIALVGIVKGVVGTFAELGQTGAGDPAALAKNISVALLSSFWGLIFSLILLIPFTVFLVLFLKRRKVLTALKANQ